MNFFTISLVILLAAISPGPDFALVTRNALKYSQKTGIMTALGIASSALFHSSYCILGYAIIISKSLMLFSVIKYIGASYLIYLGIKGLLEKEGATKSTLDKSATIITSFQAWKQGLLCNVLNPKAIFFFLALFTMMIKPTMPIQEQIGYALEIATVQLLWFSFVAVLFSHNKVKFFMGKCLHYITKVFGGILILFGVKIAMLSHQ